MVANADLIISYCRHFYFSFADHSGSSLPSLHDMVQARMEEEAIGQQPASFGLHVKNSSSCFIYRLPTKILAGIFIHCACDFHSRGKGSIYTPTAPSWVNVSYISRLWRDVAVNCQTLWTYLFVSSPRWPEELLVRSKQAPLNLHL